MVVVFVSVDGVVLVVAVLVVEVVEVVEVVVLAVKADILRLFIHAYHGFIMQNKQNIPDKNNNYRHRGLSDRSVI